MNKSSIQISKENYDKKRKRISLSLNNDEYSIIKSLALNYGLPVSIFVKKILFHTVNQEKVLNNKQEDLLLNYIELFRNIENSIYEIALKCENNEFKNFDFLNARKKIIELENILVDLIKKLN